MRGEANTSTARRTQGLAPRSRFALAGLATLACLLALPAPPASAGLYHPKPAACSFGSDGTSATSFEGLVNRTAFQQASKRLYVIALDGVHGFDASSACPGGGYPPLAGFEPLPTPKIGNEPDIEVDNSNAPSKGNIYIANGDELLGYDAAGNPLAGFPIAKPGENADWTAVAVDASGDVWAADFQRTIHEYSPTGVPLDTLDVSEALGFKSFVRSLDFDANGNLYLARDSGGVFELAAPGYESALEIDPGDAFAIAVDRASGDLYVARPKAIERYDAAGNPIEQFPASAPAGSFTGIAVDEASKAVYADERNEGAIKVDVFEALTLPDVATAPLGGLAETSATLNGSVHPDGLALSSCEFEYVTETAFQATGFTDLSSGGEAGCEPAFASIPSSGTTAVSADITGLTEGVHYRYRLAAENVNGANSSKPASFALAQPTVETVGGPIRTATTARLDSRLDPHGIATEYHFEYLTDAAYQANLAASAPPFTGATSTPDHSAGSGALTELVSQRLEELAPATTYHYRVLADNGAFGGPATGEERTLTTRATDQPLSHGHYPGPPGSDRAWEQVNLPDTSGNPVSQAAGIAASGEAALYAVSGGTSASETGTFFDYLFARRAPDGSDGHPSSSWQTESVFPSRFDATFGAWRPPTGDDGLSTLLALNLELESGGANPAAVWRIPTEGGSPAKVYEAKPGAYRAPYLFSDDGSRALLVLAGKHVDPAHESPEGERQLYDVSSGTPRMVSLLPGAGPGAGGPACGPSIGSGTFDWLPRSTHWVSADGSHAFFPSAGNEPCGTTHLYMRDFAAEETFRVDGPPLSGPDCAGALIRSTPTAVYFWTQSRLAPEDSAGSCAGGFDPGGDVYRYDLQSHALACLTCVVPGGRPANVVVGLGTVEDPSRSIAVAPDGSRLYFTTRTRLLPGAPETGDPALYRVNTETGALAYVAPMKPGEIVGENPQGYLGSELSHDGRYLAFASADPALDALTGSDNGGSAQYYLYDDQERSLLCASCPPDGSPPDAAVSGTNLNGLQPAANMTPLAENGDFAFATPTPLASADQNTAPAGSEADTGKDIYEWRDGRALLVSDGLTNWPKGAAGPEVQAISPSGRDLFFTEAAALTPDALDGYRRLYDARIGGGIDFPEAPKPCPLEVCQGTPKGAPEEANPGTSSFSGPGNVHEAPAKPRCKKGKVRKHDKCVAKKAHRKHKRAKHNRGGAK